MPEARGRLQAGNAGSTTARADHATARDHRRPDSLVADSELPGDLSKRQAVRVEPGGVLADRVRQLRLTGVQSRLPRYLAHRATVHLEREISVPSGFRGFEKRPRRSRRSSRYDQGCDWIIRSSRTLTVSAVNVVL